MLQLCIKKSTSLLLIKKQHLMRSNSLGFSSNIIVLRSLSLQVSQNHHIQGLLDTLKIIITSHNSQGFPEIAQERILRVSNGSEDYGGLNASSSAHLNSFAVKDNRYHSVTEYRRGKQFSNDYAEIYPLESQRIVDAIEAKDAKGVYKTLREAKSPQPRNLINRCFRFMLKRNPITAYEILKIYRKSYGVDLFMHKQVAESIAVLEMSHGSFAVSENFISKIFVDYMDLPHQFKKVLLPTLLVSMITTPLASVRNRAIQLYHYINENSIDLSSPILERLLSRTLYTRLSDLPYHELIKLLSYSKEPPKNSFAISHALSNLYPFDNLEMTEVAVESLLHLINRGTTHVSVDRGTLEAVMAAAARFGNDKLGMLTWDLLERLGYEPQESTYECMIQAFCTSYRKDQLAFACLAEMINCGYVPSRSLIRSMSRSIRFSVKRIENACRMIINREMGCEPSLYSLNTIISAFAENGEMDRAFDILFQDFATFDIEPDGDTYSYAMESLATSSMFKTNPNDAVEVENAEYLLQSMAKQGLKLNCYVFHEYIRILINHGKLGLAKTTYLEALALEDLDIDCKTPALLAKIYAESEGDFEAAREIVNSMKVPIPFLHYRINRWERERMIHRNTNKSESGKE